jgi:hypothetical protein
MRSWPRSRPGGARGEEGRGDEGHAEAKVNLTKTPEVRENGSDLAAAETPRRPRGLRRVS